MWHLNTDVLFEALFVLADLILKKYVGFVTIILLNEAWKGKDVL